MAPGLRGAEFYVSRHHWHSGIVVARADIPAGAWPPGVVERDFAGCRCLELGWGAPVVLHRAQADRPDGRAGRADSRPERPARRRVPRAAVRDAPMGRTRAGALHAGGIGRALPRAGGRVSSATPTGTRSGWDAGCTASRVSSTPRGGVIGSATRATPGPCARPARAGCRRASDRRAR